MLKMTQSLIVGTLFSLSSFSMASDLYVDNIQGQFFTSLPSNIIDELRNYETYLTQRPQERENLRNKFVYNLGQTLRDHGNDAMFEVEAEPLYNQSTRLHTALSKRAVEWLGMNIFQFAIADSASPCMQRYPLFDMTSVDQFVSFSNEFFRKCYNPYVVSLGYEGSIIPPIKRS